MSPTLRKGQSWRMQGVSPWRHRRLASVCAMLGMLVGSAGVSQASPPGKVACERLRQRGAANFFDGPIPQGVNAAMPKALQPPTTGTNELVVLLADFNDLAGSRTDDEFETLLFTGNDNMRYYFAEVSYGQLWVQGDVYPDAGWYRAASPSAYYINDHGGFW